MEIRFGSPAVLLLLLTIPILVILHYYFFEHNRKKAMRFANFSALTRVTGTHLITKNNSQLFLRIIILVFLIMGASQPTIWYDGDTSVTDYVIAIDSSASMIADDVPPDRLSAAKRAAIGFIDSLDAETNLAALSFAGVTFIKQPLTTESGKVKSAITNIETELSGGTDIGAAIVTAVNLLNPGEKSKSIILITDGSDTSGSFVEEGLDVAIQYAIDNHVIIHTIGIGSGQGIAGYLADTNLRATFDSNTLSLASERTGGKFSQVKTQSDIDTAFREINLESETGLVSFRAAPLIMTLGFLLLFVEWGLLNTKFRPVP